MTYESGACAKPLLMFPNRGSLAPHTGFINPFCTGGWAVPRKQDFDKRVEKAVNDLLECAPRTEFDQFHKAVNTAINWAKVKHKIDEGAAGSAFGSPEDETP